MVDIEEQMDSADQQLIATKCINGHKFKVPKEKVQASSSGKSFVTLCPKCNKVARLRKEEVYKLFGVNPRDHVAVGGLFASLSNHAPVSAAALPQQGASFQDTMRATVAPVVSEDSDDSEDGDDDADEDDNDKEYTAMVETTEDITGKKKNIKRFRVVADEEDDEADDDDEDADEDADEEDDEDEEDTDDDDDAEYARTPVKTKKQAKKVRPRVRNVVREEDEDEDDEDNDEYEDVHSRKRARKPMRKPLYDDEPIDPNEILKQVIEESGMDEISMAHIVDYVDLQPDGWQPSAIQGVLQMYISPAAATKISQRYQAELYKEDKRRQRERYLMSVVGTPAGNMRLDDAGRANIPPFNNPLTQGGFPNNGSPFNPGYNPNVGFQPPTGYQYQQQQPQRNGYPPYEAVPPQMMQMPMRREAPQLSPLQIKQMVSEELEARFEKLQTALTQSKREDALQNELSQMRALVFDVLKQKSGGGGDNQAPRTDPLLVSLLANQSDLNKSLLTHTLAKTDKEDPVQKMLVQEILNLKNQRSAPVSSSEELSQRIALQKLANELELAQQDFADKKDGRALTRDIATTALSKIGESIATAYIQSQQMSAMETASHAGLTPPPASPVAVSTAVEPVRAEMVKETPQAKESATVPSKQDVGGTGESYRVKGTPTEGGGLSIPCPVCNSEMIASPGDTSVACTRCGSSFSAGAPPTEEQRDDYHEERHEEIPSVYEYAGGDETQMPEMQETPETRPEEHTVRRPKVIL
jgi:hypothetical protein